MERNIQTNTVLVKSVRQLSVHRLVSICDAGAVTAIAFHIPDAVTFGCCLSVVDESQ